jgi:uncharacterized phage-associated protein
MLHSAVVAKYFLLKQRSLDDESSDLSNLKLQKLVYYAQGLYLGIYGQPLFADDLEAWPHGPVVPALYHEYKGYGNAPIPPPDDFEMAEVPQETRSFLDRVYGYYGQYSAWRLREMSHIEAPWKDSFERGSGSTIEKDAMKAYFASHTPALLRSHINPQLERAVTAAATRSDAEQALIAERLNKVIEEADEIEDEKRWQGLLCASHDVLESLFDEITDDYKSGRTEPLDG